jgi:hypothetical protein
MRLSIVLKDYCQPTWPESPGNFWSNCFTNSVSTFQVNRFFPEPIRKRHGVCCGFVKRTGRSIHNSFRQQSAKNTPYQVQTNANATDGLKRPRLMLISDTPSFFCVTPDLSQKQLESSIVYDRIQEYCLRSVVDGFRISRPYWHCPGWVLWRFLRQDNFL